MEEMKIVLETLQGGVDGGRAETSEAIAKVAIERPGSGGEGDLWPPGRAWSGARRGTGQQSRCCNTHALRFTAGC